MRDSMLEGGVTVHLGTGPTSAWPFPAGDLLLCDPECFSEIGVMSEGSGGRWRGW